MVFTREIQLKRQQRDSRKENARQRFLCKILRVDGNIEVPGKPGFVWVQERAPDADSSPFHAFNVSTQKTAGLEVWVELTADGWEVESVATGLLRHLSGYSGNPYLPNHARSHEWPDFAPQADAINVFPRALTMLRCYPGEAGGLTVSVAPLEYSFNGADVVFGGEHNIDISTHQPAAGQALLVGVYLDTTTNTIGTVAGTAIQDAPVYIPPRPVFPDGAKASARVKLDGSQTTMSEADFFDARKWLGGDTVGGEGNQILVDQLALVEAELDYALTKHIVEG